MGHKLRIIGMVTTLVFLVGCAKKQLRVAGNHLWSKSFGSSGTNIGCSVATDGRGNILLAGLFEHKINFGGRYLKTAGKKDIFLAKFDGDGGHLWSKSFGGDEDDAGYFVTSDVKGNILITGVFEGEGIFLAKFDGDGNLKWSKGYVGKYEGASQSITTDARGNIFLTGSYQKTLNIGNRPSRHVWAGGSFGRMIALRAL